MRSDGTPIAISGSTSKTLVRERIGGREGLHDEAWLQRLIHRHPTCLPMDQIEPGFAVLVPVCMELPLSSGYLDNLLMTPDGDIVIVEAKLWQNPEARRDVVAQALDYANSLFGLNYEKLEAAILKAEFDGDKPTTLYGIFGNADTLEEPDFIDAVNRNLRNGRIVVLVVGDGIRSEAETLVEGLQAHAGFHFTFALVELAVFRGATEDDLVVMPRTLLKTYMVERGIVRIEDGRTEVVSAQTDQDKKPMNPRQSITSEQFFEAMRERHPDLPDNLQGFLDKLASLGVYPEFKRSLNLKWDPPSGNPVNLGYIMRNGQLWTDATPWSGTDPAIARAYADDVANMFGGQVAVRDNGNFYVAINDKAPRIENLVDHFDSWFDAIERFQQHMREHAAEEI